MKAIFKDKKLLKFTSIILVVVIASVVFWQYHNTVSMEASGVVSVDVGPGAQVKAGDEIIAERTENAKKYYLGDNSYAVEASLSALHYKDNYSDDQEQWKDIDLTFANGEITRAPYILTVDGKNKAFTVYDKKTGKTTSIRLNKIGEKDIRDIKDSGKKESQVSKGKILWSDVAADMDLAITAENTRVNFDWIVKSEDSPHQVEFEIEDGDLPICYQGFDAQGQKVDVTTQKDGNKIIETIEKGGNYPKTINPTIYDMTGWSNYDDGYCNTNHWGWGGNIHPVGNSTFFGGASHDWYRWSGFNIPANATIRAESYISVFNWQQFGTVLTRVYFDKQQSPSYPTSYADYMSRSLTTNYVDWNASDWSEDTFYNSPSIQTIIQELVDTYGQLSTIQCLHKDNGSSTDDFLAMYDDCTAIHVSYTAPATVSNTPSTYNFGVVETSSTLSTGLNYFNITNNSGSAVNITIGGSDLSGGTGWTLSDTATPGATSYGLKAGLNGGSYNVIVKKSAPFNTLKSNLSNSSSQGWGLQIQAPTSNTDITQKEGSIILTATLY
jgi:hypothetical protein